MMDSRKLFRFIISGALLALTACAVPAPASMPVPPVAQSPAQNPIADGFIPLQQLPGWQNENHVAALQAFRHGCQKKLRPYGAVSAFESDHAEYLKPERWQYLCRIANAIADRPDSAAMFFMHNFQALAIRDNNQDQGLITGYYEAELRASTKPSKQYRYPIYKMPSDADLQFTRAQIDAGALKNKNLELAWADDFVDVLALHIQGSGKAIMDDGQILQIGFAGKNIHPYQSIGKTFLDRKILPSDQINMQSIENYFHAHPAQAASIIQTNPSYIFFRPIIGDGPIGAFGIPILPERSVAVDRDIYPLGLPMWLDVPHPDPQKPVIQKMVFAHDTGSAIKGPIRADYFFGAGSMAKQQAGMMRGRGKLYVLLPRDHKIAEAVHE